MNIKTPINQVSLTKSTLIFFLSFLLFSCSNDDSSIPSEETEEIIEPPLIPTASCENGMAGIYPCKDYDLMAHMSLSEFDAISANDSWGWTDPSTGKEYVLMGLGNGTAFIDISNPTKPVYLGKLVSQTPPALHRDIKVYQNHAFVVSESEGHGLQIFDLTKLRNVANAPATFQADATYNEFGHAHNIVINESTGFAYVVGSDTFAGGPHIINIQNPLNPTFAGGYALDGYSHDAQVVTYNGPDTDYIGKEIYIGSNENEVAIVDITDKSNPKNISSITYENVGYTHQGWLTEDQKFFLVGDELDELKFGNNTKTFILDFTDLDNPKSHTNYTGSLPAIDHNGYVKDNLFYQANYTGGMRVLDISDIENKNISEVGFFDSYPLTNSNDFNGAWNVYPFFESGNIVISDIDNGLFIVKKKK
ncbi:choice-of-anchor B family protein [Gillisia hiemivivida]|uniref:Choice-of-anchor B family protein n=1 Tax=Gillisia hiemivivida TaxID=291190 RepID=A0A5C6ZT73_9FLAO|nr:choice-of-anchor B family protein [Gillisia hiemivivida]TXD93293.1 choice-of-anchor B family protein [Gillisia hiemivivida]